MAARGFDLNLLPTLNALLEERNVTRAAERLSLGQPAVSAALARLRRHFDDPLLVREGSSYTLSTLAESRVEPVRLSMATLDSTLASRQDFVSDRDVRTLHDCDERLRGPGLPASTVGPARQPGAGGSATGPHHTWHGQHAAPGRA